MDGSWTSLGVRREVGEGLPHSCGDRQGIVASSSFFTHSLPLSFFLTLSPFLCTPLDGAHGIAQNETRNQVIV